MARRVKKAGKKGDWVTTKRAVAQACAVSDRTVRDWMLRLDWMFSTTGPWYVPGIQKWRDLVLTRTGEPKGKVTKLDLEKQKLEVDIALKKITRRQREGELVPKEHLERAGSTAIGFMRQRIGQWVATVPQHFADSAAIRTILTSLYDDFCEDMQQELRGSVININAGQVVPKNGRVKNKARVKAAKTRHRKVKRRR